ncbi:hypothetical protein NHQ30_008479 [Ciborinia camelliae]|nr:hypothetical protein NHQ30_008479 [Ciborinia camelliae]
MRDTFQNDFSRTILRIKRVSSIVERKADVARMSKDESKYKEELELMNSMLTSSSTNNTKVKYNNIPVARNNKFRGREEDMAAVKKWLHPSGTVSSLKSTALFGMGGAGKTEIAIQ